jgi:hypothetical protein
LEIPLGQVIHGWVFWVLIALVAMGLIVLIAWGVVWMLALSD